jgi:signal transduction histidine kinase
LLALAVHLRLAAQRAEQAPEQAAGLIQDAEAELQVATDELRELSQGIHPAILTDLGLADAIRSVAARSAVQVKLLELPTWRVGGLAEATAYFVFMEAVANAQKHADASTIRVRASSTLRELRIEVADDGVGGAAEGAGSGLRGLRQRVEDVGGSFSVESTLARGTLIVAAIPLDSMENS